ncbi:MAG: hypothetical protein LBR15_06400 [Methanobrevibacter sp.]|jgi:hypothetical protein|nr:hypothetical protein [Candidatus Methanovirga australis]
MFQRDRQSFIVEAGVELSQMMAFRVSDNISNEDFITNNLIWWQIWSILDVHYKTFINEIKLFSSDVYKEVLKQYLKENGFVLEVILRYKKEYIEPDHILRNFENMVEDFKRLLEFLNKMV